jgi:class 3 adenylate cyclase/tetratricopeptide (TPR) repeat protein
MTTVCHSCRQELPDEFPFCPFCGAALDGAAVRPAAEERKVITCLFCDLVGFTAQAEQLDPEDVRALLAPYHARVREELERHGGTVEKFIGDAVMTVFGAPVAHEDDPERAVRAALAIRETARAEGIELRIGVTTGEALVALGARPAEGEGMASGDVVNTAARLQGAAPVYGVLVGETTYRATRHVIDYRPVAPVEAKGKSEPVPAWEAIEARARFGTEVLDHSAGELVGRDQELDVLRSALRRVRDERSTQLITLVGVPGIGKSRLLHELSRVADADPELITWRQGRCLAYGDGVTFWALAEIVKAQAGILEADTEDEAARKLRVAIEDVISGPQDVAWVEARLRPLVGLGGEAELAGDRRGETFTAWRRFLEALADQRTLVAVFEDLQWADDGLLDFVDELADWGSDVPLLLVCTARPELLSRRPSWGGGKLNAATIALSPLSDLETAQLIAHVLDRAVLPADTQRILLERADGNPLYAEQFALLYEERGSAEKLPLPENLQGIVAARLDGLPPDEKALLQDAAIVGKLFWTGCLERDAEECEPLLHALARKGFLRAQRRSSVAGEDEHAFAHVLVRDVAYSQIPRAERARKHRRVAEWIESLGRADDHAEMVAHHWRAALELAQATGRDDEELVEHTRRSLGEAGDRAAGLNAYAAAEDYYAAALALTSRDDPERPDLLFRRARALHLATDERREAALVEARDAAIAAGDREDAAEASAFLSRIAWHQGARDVSVRHLEEAERLISDAPASAAKGRVLANSARQRTLAGDQETGIRLAEEALAIAEELGLPELEANAHATIGTAQIHKPAGRAELERALELARAANSPDTSTILVNLAVAAEFAGDVRKEDELVAEAHETAQRFGDVDNMRFSRGNRIWVRWALGYWDEAIARADTFIVECFSDPHYLEGAVRAVRGWIRAGRGDEQGALEDVERALELARGIGDPQAVVPTTLHCCQHYAWLGRDAEARALADEAFELIRAHSDAAATLGILTPVASRLGIEEQLRKALENAPDGPWTEAARAAAAGDHARAADLYAGTGFRSSEAMHRFAAAEMLIAAGRRGEGEAQLAQALDFYRSVGANAYLERGNALLAASA